MQVYLIGPRAAGKSTLGAALAERCGRPFIDTDQWVREKYGEDIPAIVAREGWEGFRRKESSALRAAAEHTTVVHAAAEQDATGPRRQAPAGVTAVIATGGGIILAPENRSFMRESGTVFFLCAPVEVLAARLCNDIATQRPSLTGRSPAQEIADVLAARLPLYEAAAHYRLDARRNPQDLCDEILRLSAAGPHACAGKPQV